MYLISVCLFKQLTKSSVVSQLNFQFKCYDSKIQISLYDIMKGGGDIKNSLVVEARRHNKRATNSDGGSLGFEVSSASITFHSCPLRHGQERGFRPEDDEDECLRREALDILP